MDQRISAGVIVEYEDRILMVRHPKPEVYDFWVAPGGGVQGVEDLRTTAVREVREETGLDVDIQHLAYIEERINPYRRECKMWFTARLLGGTLSAESREAMIEHIVEAAWLHRTDFQDKIVFPPMLLEAYWQDRETGFAFPRYMGVRPMEFY